MQAMPINMAFRATAGFMLSFLFFLTGFSNAKTSTYYLDTTRLDAVVSPMTQTASGGSVKNSV